VCQLVYYKKGNKTWGTPLVISAIPEAGRTTDYEIYPNPVKDWISVKVTSSVLPLQLELFDLSGKTIMQLVINSKTATIKLEKDMKGIYLYRIIDKSKNISYGKLVVE
jgi:hypothetical protein